MRYLSVCSGIEAASVAWHPLGWKPLAFSEIEPFPRAVLQHHYPDVPLHGDFTRLRDEDWIAGADILVRRLTPVECSRLQGFPDDYLTSVSWRGKCPPPDGPMYKALGNSMAVPVMRWIGRRIAESLARANSTAQEERAA